MLQPNGWFRPESPHTLVACIARQSYIGQEVSMPWCPRFAMSICRRRWFRSSKAGKLLSVCPAITRNSTGYKSKNCPHRG